MQDELNEAGARGYRFAGPRAGATAFGGREAVVIVALDPEGRRFRYILLATNRTGTMQSEMNEAPPEYNFAGMTVFSSTFGGREAGTGGRTGGRGGTTTGTLLGVVALTKARGPSCSFDTRPTFCYCTL